MPLAVSGAFHSPFMAEAAEAFAALLEPIPFADAEIAVLSNTDPSPCRDGATLKARLRQQMTTGVRWRETMEELERSGITTAVEVAAGGATTCARLASGAATCWGSNTRGELGTGSVAETESTTPTTVTTVDGAAAISVGQTAADPTLSFACVLRLNRKAYCWGANANGALDIAADTDPHEIPLEIVGYDGPGLPTAPTLTAAEIGDRRVTATWTPATAPDWQITGYTATAGPDGGSCTTDDAGRSCTITGLRNGREYDITVTATNGFGAGDASAALTRVPGIVPSVPGEVAGSRVGDSARVEWRASDGYGNDVREYEAEVDGVGTCTATDAGRSCLVPGLDPFTTYSVRVRTRNDIGWSAWSSGSSLDISRPGAPRVNGIVPANGSLLVGWAAAPPNEIGRAHV